VGQHVANGVPYLRGLEHAACNATNLKLLGAAMAASGAVALYHIEGVTPEAENYKSRISNFERHVIGIASLDEGYAELNHSTTDSIDLVWIGCPHASLDEIERVAARLGGRPIRTALWITTARQVATKPGSAGCSGASKPAAGVS
jgi:predicted aconitase